MHKVAIIQARMGSTRFPKKILAQIYGKTMLERVIERLSESKCVDQIVVATTNADSDREVIQYCIDHKLKYFAGSEMDVLERYYETAKMYHADVVIRVTSDCPLFDAGILDEGIKKFLSLKDDYVSNVLPPTYPDGLDFSIMRFSVLEDAFKKANLQSEREHVVPWIWKNTNLEGGSLYRASNISVEGNYSEMRWTVDYPQDLELVERVYAHFENKKFTWMDVTEFMKKNPELFKLNDSIVRDEGYLKSIASDFTAKNEVKK